MNRKVFVYGTLKKGEANHRLIEAFVKSITPATTRGWLFDLGPYPAMVEGHGFVHGELVEFHPDDVARAFEVMDWLEGVSSTGHGLYDRVKIECWTDSKELISCYSYVMLEALKEQLSYTSELISDGVWPFSREPLTCFYVAYGSCMSRSSFSKTVSTFDFIGAVSIPDSRVGFTHYSRIKWGGGVADLLPAEGQTAEGVLYRIPIDQVPSVDAREGADLDRPIYRRIPITVYRDQIPIAAFTYEVINKRSEEYPPHPDYMETILEGADLLTSGYVDSLISHAQSISLSPAMKGGR